MKNKTELRLIAKNMRKSLDIQKISTEICSKIRLLDIYKKAKNVLLFYPLRNEINLLDLINNEKNFYLPRINGEDLEVCQFQLGDKLKESSFKTKEPLTNPINIEILDLILLPALAADKNNYRLGYGKGYYDRLLEKTNAYTILPIAKELVFENIPTENHDKKVNLIITD